MEEVTGAGNPDLVDGLGELLLGDGYIGTEV